MMSGLDTFLWAVVVNAVLAAIMLGVYILLKRTHSASRRLLAPRLELPVSEGGIADNEELHSRCDELARLPGLGALFKATDDNVRHAAGSDPLMHVQLLRLVARILGPLAAISPAVIAVFATAPHSDPTDDNNSSSFTKYVSIARIKANDPRLWTVTVVCWLSTAWVIALLNKFWKQASAERIEALLSRSGGFTVLVRDLVPISSQDSTKKQIGSELASATTTKKQQTRAADRKPGKGLYKYELIAEMEHFYPDMKLACSGCPDQRQLNAAIKKRDQALRRLMFRERLNAKFEAAFGQTLLADKRAQWLGASRSRLEIAEHKVEKEREATVTSKFSSAFVTFSNCADAAAATQVMHSDQASEWNITQAPESNTILHDSLHARWEERATKFAAVRLLLVVFLLFFVLVATFVAGLASIDTLTSILPALSPLEDFPALTSLINGLLPGLVLNILINLCPPVFRAMGRMWCAPSLVVINAFALQSFAILLILAIHLGATVANAILRSLDSIVSGKPSASTLVDALGNGIATSSTVFISFVLVKTAGLTVQLSRVIPVILFHLLGCFGDAGAPSRWKPSELDIAARTPIVILMCSLGFTYASLGPLVTVFAWVYAAAAAAVFRVEACLVQRKWFDSSYAFFPAVSSSLTISLIVSLVINVCLLGVKLAPAQAVLTTLPIVALLQANRWLHWRYGPAFEAVPRYIALSQTCPNPRQEVNKYIPEAMQPVADDEGHDKTQGNGKQSTVNAVAAAAFESNV